MDCYIFATLSHRAYAVFHDCRCKLCNLLWHYCFHMGVLPSWFYCLLHACKPRRTRTALQVMHKLLTPGEPTPHITMFVNCRCCISFVLPLLLSFMVLLQYQVNSVALGVCFFILLSFHATFLAQLATCCFSDKFVKTNEAMSWSS